MRPPTSGKPCSAKSCTSGACGNLAGEPRFDRVAVARHDIDRRGRGERAPVTGEQVARDLADSSSALSGIPQVHECAAGGEGEHAGGCHAPPRRRGTRCGVARRRQARRVPGRRRIRPRRQSARAALPVPRGATTRSRRATAQCVEPGQRGSGNRRNRRRASSSSRASARSSSLSR